MIYCCAENTAHGADNWLGVELRFGTGMFYAGERVPEDDLPQFLPDGCANGIGFTVATLRRDTVRFTDQVHGIFPRASALQSGKPDGEDRTLCSGRFGHGEKEGKDQAFGTATSFPFAAAASSSSFCASVICSVSNIH